MIDFIIILQNIPLLNGKLVKVGSFRKTSVVLYLFSSHFGVKKNKENHIFPLSNNLNLQMN